MKVVRPGDFYLTLIRSSDPVSDVGCLNVDVQIRSEVQVFSDGKRPSGLTNGSRVLRCNWLRC